MAQYAIVDSGGNVVNLVEWDGETSWQPPPGTTAIPASAGAAIGGTYADGQFTPPASPPPPPNLNPTISRVQCLIALSNAGLLTSVQNWVTTQSAATQIAWANAATFSLQDAIIQQGAAALGLSAPQLSELFAAAAAVTI